MKFEIPKIITELFKSKKFSIGFGIIVLIIFMMMIGPLVYKIDPFEPFSPNLPPSKEHPLGTDSRGYDVLAQLLSGIRNSLFIGVVASTIAIAIGLVIGSIAGFRGGLIDSALMAVSEIILMVPTLLLLIYVATLFEKRSFLLVASIIGITSWPGFSKAVRSYILSLKTREYVYMSRMAGLSDFRIILEDMLPGVLVYTIVSYAGITGAAMIAEASLSILAVGTTEGITLGIMLFWAQQYFALTQGFWWTFIPPGALIVMVAVSLLLIALSLDEILNPRLRG